MTTEEVPFDISSKKVILPNKKLSSFKVKITLPLIQEWQVEELSLKMKKESLKMISKITFSFLVSLFLGKNNIQSIQILTAMNLPCLQSLTLSKNNIRQIKPLKKGNLKKLEYLFLDQNKILEIDSLTLANLKNLQMMVCEIDLGSQGSYTSDNLSPLLKTNWKKSKILIQIVPRNRIKVNSVLKYFYDQWRNYFWKHG